MQRIASKEFRKLIRSYNNALSFTLLGARIDRTVNGPFGVNTFRIQGEMSHRIGGLLPESNVDTGFSQIYVVGDGGLLEAEHRSRASGRDLNTRIVIVFQRFFDRFNPYARSFRRAADILDTRGTVALNVRTLPPGQRDARRYNRPTTDEVAMVIEGDGCVGENSRDIILYKRQGGFERISELHTGYLALRYPILFPWGAQGYDEHYRMPTTARKCKVIRLE